MAKIKEAPSNARSVNPFGMPDDKVTAHQLISVTTYASGARKASHGRMDMATRRIIFTQLSHPVEDYACGHSMAHWLADAAVELLDDCHAQESLF